MYTKQNVYKTEKNINRSDFRSRTLIIKFVDDNILETIIWAEDLNFLIIQIIIEGTKKP